MKNESPSETRLKLEISEHRRGDEIINGEERKTIFVRTEGTGSVPGIVVQQSVSELFLEPGTTDRGNPSTKESRVRRDLFPIVPGFIFARFPGARLPFVTV